MIGLHGIDFEGLLKFSHGNEEAASVGRNPATFTINSMLNAAVEDCGNTLRDSIQTRNFLRIYDKFVVPQRRLR